MSAKIRTRLQIDNDESPICGTWSTLRSTNQARTDLEYGVLLVLELLLFIGQ